MNSGAKPRENESIIDCPSIETIAMAASGAIDETVSDELAEHLAQCTVCARRFETALRSIHPPASTHPDDIAPTAFSGTPEIDAPGGRDWRRASVVAGRFQVERLIATGGMAEVYRCYDKVMSRPVAVKKIRTDKIDASYAERFERESRIQSALNHPNVVSIFEVGRWHGDSFIVMELVDGPSLKDILAERPLKPADAARVLAAIARALHFAHEKGITHRDMKPANVLLAANVAAAGAASLSDTQAGGDGPVVSRDVVMAEFVPKIADFGLAKISGGMNDLSRSDAVVGTPAYLSPEQASGRNREIGPWSDIYSLGVVLYECLTGFPPFKADSFALTVMQICHSRPITPRTLQPGVPRDLETICMKCLEKEPARRYASARELADDLDRFLAGRPIHARPTPWFVRLALWTRRNRLLAAAIAASFLLLAAVAALSLQFGLVQSRLKELALTESNRAAAAAADALAQRDKAYERYLEEAQNLFTLTAQMQSPGIDRIDSPELRAIRQTAFDKFHQLVDKFVSDPEMVRRYPGFTLEFLYHSAALSRASNNRERLTKTLETMLRLVPPGSLADARSITLQINSLGNLALYRYQAGRVDASFELYDRLLRFGESLDPEKLGHNANIQGVLLATAGNYAEILKGLGRNDESAAVIVRRDRLKTAWTSPDVSRP